MISGFDGTELGTVYGDAAGDFFGAKVRGVGDVDGDGFDDFAVGADGHDGKGPESGLVRVFSGVDLSVLYSWNGDANGDQMGSSIATGGWGLTPGFSDVIVGMRTDDDNGVDSGAARVFSGMSGSVLFTFLGDSAGDEFGTSVAGGKDLNGDGWNDFVVGAPLRRRRRGRRGHGARPHPASTARSF